MGQENPLSDELISKIDEANQKLAAVKNEIGKVIVGQEELIDRLLIALLTEGHILLEGVPGIAKTLAVNSFSRVLQLDFKRIQFTPDLLPSDLIGTSIYNPKEASFSVEKGPVFTNVVLADEINRAPPKVQSALLEVMQERQVTIAGQTFKTKSPFLVLGTQNPIEHEGTYPLPEAQTDRFMMKVLVDYPSIDEEKEIVKRVGSSAKPVLSAVFGEKDIIAMRDLVRMVYLDEKILNYIVQIVFETREPQDLLEYGASPRASIYLAMCSKAHALMQGRAYVTPFDVRAVGKDVLRHRLILSYEAQAQEITPDEVVDSIFDQIAVP